MNIELNKFSNEFELSPTLAANETVLRLRDKGKPIIHMGFGQAPFPVPERIKKALCDNAYNNKYLPALGLEELRDTILHYYNGLVGIDPDKYQVITAPGSKLILYGLQMAVKGDLLMPVPSWVSYAPQARMLGDEVIRVPTKLDDAGYHIGADQLKEIIISARARGLNPTKIILNYPSNPTGLTISDNDLKEIAEICIEENILIISDEIYGLVSFDGEYRSISKYAPDNTVISSGLSKHLSLGGWRFGFGIIPKSINGLTDLMQNIASETWSCVPSPVQYAVIEAYKGHEDIEKYIKDCCDIHCFINQYIAKELSRLGVICPLPQGGFYNYPDFLPYQNELSNIGIKTSQQLSAYLLEEYGLVSLAGASFGAEPQTLTLRLSGCDYDGEKVLNAYQSGKELNEQFIIDHAPNVKEAICIFEGFIVNLRK